METTKITSDQDIEANASISGKKVAECKYGENAHQTPAALYSSGTDDPLALDKFIVVEGTPPSYNNWCDIDRLLQTMTHVVAAYRKNSWAGNYVALGAKHGNLCGASVCGSFISQRNTLAEMMLCDPLAIFGGLVMTNFVIDGDHATELTGKMLDGIIAPGFSTEAITKLKRKGDKCRFIKNDALERTTSDSLDQAPRFRYVRGGFLQQPNYTFMLDLDGVEIKKFGPHSSLIQRLNLLLAWAIGSTSNSNTITLVKNGMLIGNGVGQQDRVGAAIFAIGKAEHSTHDIRGAVAYSDSFFPFPDGPEALIDAGVSAILTSSGSVNDRLTIELCEKRGVVLYMIPDAIGRGFFGH